MELRIGQKLKGGKHPGVITEINNTITIRWSVEPPINSIEYQGYTHTEVIKRFIPEVEFCS